MSKEFLRYDPAPVPNNVDELPVYLANTLLEIRAAIEVARNGHLDVVYAEPDKPYQGDIRYADGTSWNPGGTGEGIYFYNAAGAWVKL